MGIIEIISAIFLILSCIFIIIMVLMQDSKRGMSQTLAGGSGDNFYQKNSGRSREARLARATRTAAILFFVITLVVNVFAIYLGGGDDNIGADGEEEIDWDSLLADMEDDSGDYEADDEGELDDGGDDEPADEPQE